MQNIYEYILLYTWNENDMLLENEKLNKKPVGVEFSSNMYMNYVFSNHIYSFSPVIP